MNKRSMRTNLEEAKEELESLIAKLDSDEDCGESYLLVGFQHAFFHMNFAWNTRRSPDVKVVNLTQRDFIRWGGFPIGLEWKRFHRISRSS